MRISDWSTDVCSSDLVGMSMSLALEVAQQGITVNSVAPGWITTGSTTAEEAQAAGYTQMGRDGRPEEVAEVVEFLASSEDRTSVVWGRRCAERLVVGGGRIIKKIKNYQEQ